MATEMHEQASAALRGTAVTVGRQLLGGGFLLERSVSYEHAGIRLGSVGQHEEEGMYCLWYSKRSPHIARKA